MGTDQGTKMFQLKKIHRFPNTSSIPTRIKLNEKYALLSLDIFKYKLVSLITYFKYILLVSIYTIILLLHSNVSRDRYCAQLRCHIPNSRRELQSSAGRGGVRIRLIATLPHSHLSDKILLQSTVKFVRQ